MPRILNPAKMTHAAELYASGKTFKQIAAELGMDSESLRLALIRRGVKPRPRSYKSPGILLPVPDGLIDAYLTGTSEKTLARLHGVDRAVVSRWLRDSCIPRRSVGEANALHCASLAPTERIANIAAAQEARRGRNNSDAHQGRIAQAREAVGYGGRTSPGTDYLSALLTERGIPHTREKAIGRYNVDIALGAYPVAVEVLGGNWHGYKPVHAKRTPCILNAGWSLLFIWNQKRVPLGPQAFDYLVTFLEETSINPPPVGEYRVIRGDGQLITFGSADDDEFPLVPPSESHLK